MNPPHAAVWSPSRRLFDDLHEHADALIQGVANVTERAILHGRSAAKRPRVDEIATLAWFFIHGLPELETLWNQRLRRTTVEFKGVFCHKSGRLGPVVGFDDPERRCELSDLLVIVTEHAGNMPAQIGNAVFLQAKSERWPIKGDSSKKQQALYEDADAFTFKDLSDIRSAVLGENIPAGLRTMPTARERGLKFWFYKRATYYRFNRLHWHADPHWRMASTTAEPLRIDRPEFDTWFPETLFELVAGRDGLGFTPPAVGDFGWNRIVRDVIIASVGKALAVRNKVNARNVTRVHGLTAIDIAMMFNETAVAIANPFTDLGDLFGTELADAFKKLNEATRTVVHEQKIGRQEEPPNWNDNVGGDDNGGGASFIWIKFINKQSEGRARPFNSSTS